MMQFTKAHIQQIPSDLVLSDQVRLSVLREDLTHPFLSGNKWRKLKYNLEDFNRSGKKVVLTFGGKYSNHLVACAAAANVFKIPLIGILRGDEEVNNSYVDFFHQCGMKTLSLRREEYRKRTEPSFINNLLNRCVTEFPEFVNTPSDIFIIPEGGSNASGAKGCGEIMDDIPDFITDICVAVGTGTTLAGISAKTKKHQRAIGISVLRGENWLLNSVIEQGAISERTTLLFDYHFGGYAKTTHELTKFCGSFSSESGIAIEPVYTGKLFYAVLDLIRNNFFSPGAQICIVHTGGIFDFTKSF